MKYFQARETGAVLRFVSLRRRELKYSFYPTDALDVMFVSGRRRELKYLAKAAPWTAAPVRLPKETRVEIRHTGYSGSLGKRSSPYGDVS